jgi:adenylate cyclase class IV
MQNLEFKAELRHLNAARQQCVAIGATPHGVLQQVDTYFKLADGRLKRRETQGQPIEWIWYHRANDIRPRVSHYSILTDEQARRRWGTLSLREWLCVRKRRELWIIDNVRIHLDEVEGLGTFIEFEALMTEGTSANAREAAVAQLRQFFAPVLGEPVGVSYSDLMAQQLQQPIEGR